MGVKIGKRGQPAESEIVHAAGYRFQVRLSLRFGSCFVICGDAGGAFIRLVVIIAYGV